MKGAIVALVLPLLLPGASAAYPLDQYEQTGIDRLRAYDLAREILLERGTLVPGSLLKADDIRLRLVDRPDFALPKPDPELTARVEALAGEDVGDYGIAILDLSDPDRPIYAEVNGRRAQNPGSVGKIVVALAWFQALADLQPDDLEARRRVLYESTVTADGFIQTDHHTVPIWKAGDPRVLFRPIAEGDQGNLWTWLDWMTSASSNAAASTLMAQLLLLDHFGAEYPPSAEAAAAFFDETPKQKLGERFLELIQDPLRRNGLDPSLLRQGSFFTREGKRRVPGTSSVATSRELLRFLVLMEQGKLVDPWSSLEIKRLLYLTDARARYASHPTLDESAVYYKSGSLYACDQEPGFTCEKYKGNRVNFMNSIAIVEAEEGGVSLDYLVVVLSNVLRKDSAEAHAELADRVHRLIRSRHPAPGAARDPEATTH